MTKAADHKQKIVFVVPAIAHEGISKQVLLQIDALLAQKYYVVLVVLTKAEINLLQRFAPTLPLENVVQLQQADAYLSVKSLLAAVSVARRLSSVLHEVKPDILFAHAPYAHFVVRLSMLLSAKVRTGVKVWQYFHFPQYAEFPLQSFRRRFINSLNKQLAAKFDYGHVFVSKAVEQDIVQQLIRLKNRKVIYNALPVAGSANADLVPRTNLARDEAYTIVVPGRLEKVKGQLWFLDVFKQFVTTVSGAPPYKVKLVLAGSGSLYTEINTKVKALDLTSAVHLTGQIDSDHISVYLQQADLVVIPSLLEGFGLVALEALMVGATVLSSDAGGLGEVLEHGKSGYLFKAGDKEDCLSKLLSLYHSKGCAGIQKAEVHQLLNTKFSFGSHVAELIKIIEG